MNLHDYHELQMPLEAEPLSVKEVERVRAIGRFELDRLKQAREALQARLYQRDPDGFNDRFAEDEGERAAADIETLTTGNWRGGYWDKSLRLFADGPGIATLENFIARCDKRLAEHHARQTATFPATYRYMGARGVHVLDGRVLKPGALVMLSETQFDAFRDRFERVEQEQPETVTT
jgi:hypothetical protein